MSQISSIPHDFLRDTSNINTSPTKLFEIDSINNTLAPYLAALLAEATPPDPPPMTK